MARGQRKKKQTKTTRKKAPPRRSLIVRLGYWTAVAGVWGVLALAALIGWFAYDLPSLDKIADPNRKPSITLMAADGSRLAAFGEVYGETLTVDELPPALIQAVLAVEDRRFYEHPGVDPLGLLRAMVANIEAGGIVQGGSTITQQLAKNVFLTPERSYKRKVQEALLAFWLESRLTKDQILSLYLNRVYLGAGTYGVDAASRRYFGTSAKDVNLYEAALLAGLLKAPSRYNPANDPAQADGRTHQVLLAMVDAEFITAETAEAALKSKGRSQAAAGGRRPRYFADWVLDQVYDYVGKGQQDLVVLTTLDPKLQAIAGQELRAALDSEGSKRGVEQGAFLAMSPDGAVRAMVGGRDYGASQFNRAVQALRQPGSAFKPFVYLAALEAGWTPDDRMVDGPIRIGNWAPKNYGDRYYGDVTLREAYARSLNSVSAQLTQKVGPEQVAEVGRRLGITSQLSPHLSLALGASEVSLLDLTSAYAVFANQGRGVWPYAITEIRGSNGKVLYRREGSGPGRVVAPSSVNRMNNLMTAVVEWGTGKAARSKRPSAGKTGTSQDFRDAWFVGYTAELVAGAWFGNDDGRPMKGVTGGSLPARLWGRVMARGLEGLPPQPLPDGGVVVASRAEPKEEEGGFIGRILKSLTGESDERTSAGAAPKEVDRGR
ncbi:MAG: PBP1A family penicillin-binding protein [Pseudomonadota bacterium]